MHFPFQSRFPPAKKESFMRPQGCGLQPVGMLAKYVGDKKYVGEVKDLNVCW